MNILAIVALGMGVFVLSTAKSRSLKSVFKKLESFELVQAKIVKDNGFYDRAIRKDDGAPVYKKFRNLECVYSIDGVEYSKAFETTSFSTKDVELYDTVTVLVYRENPEKFEYIHQRPIGKEEYAFSEVKVVILLNRFVGVFTIIGGLLGLTQ